MSKKLTTHSNFADGRKTEILTNSSKATTATPSENVTMRQHIVQNFRLIWLDASINESDEEYQRSIIHLRRIVNTIDTFIDDDRCMNLLNQIKDEKVFLIVSGDLAQRIVPLIHHLSQLDCIYVFCSNHACHEEWAKDWSKLKGIFTRFAPICRAIQEASRRCDQYLIPMSFVSVSQASLVNQNLDQLDSSFMYTQLLKEILLEIDHDDEQSIQRLANYCRGQNIDNNQVSKFEQEYHHHTPIWWYTYQCFLYPMLNRALRTLEVNTIMNMGFFIHDLHRHIEQLHSEQSCNQHERLLKVYRGQGLSKTDFEKLMQIRSGLMSFNNFLSTSKDRDVSFAFADSNRDNPDLIGVLFEITIDRLILSPPFALLDNVSNFYSEHEILFSMHTVFRVSDIEPIDGNDRLWQVQLILTTDNDPLLSTLTRRLREETGEESNGWARLGRLLLRLGEFHKAEEVYQALLEQTSDDSERAHLYHQLGCAKDQQSNYQQALTFYDKTLEIRQKMLPPNHPDMAVCYGNIGGMYGKMGEYSKALSFYEKALEIQQKNLPSNHPDLATCYNNIGLAYDNMSEYSKALSFYEKVLEIQKKTLPSNHPDLATCYSNIGLVYDNMGKYLEALSFYEKALEIRQKYLPPNHPSLATTYNNIGAVYHSMDEYSKALSFYEKALEIRQSTLPLNHPDFAQSYNNIGAVYMKTEEFPKALSSFEKALEIWQKTITPDHPDLATSYMNMGAVYNKTNEYSKALSFYEKALESQQKSLPSNHPSLATTYNNIGAVYHSMNEYSKALSFYEKALEIRQSTLPLKHPDFAQSYNNMGGACYKIAEYSKALSSFEKALEIWLLVLPSTHPLLAMCRRHIQLVKEKIDLSR